MTRWRHHKHRQRHICLLVNKKAANYNQRYIRKLTDAIRREGGYYTVFAPDSAMALYQTAQKICGFKRWHRSVPPHFHRRGKVTSLVACGGDGTFNLVARVALKANLPIGVIPLGSYNNITRSLYDSDDPDIAIKKILGRSYRKIDSATVANQALFGSLGLGFVPELSDILRNKKKPRFSLGWGQLSLKAASLVKTKKMIIKIDSFRFEVSPIILNVNLLSYTAGLPLSPASIFDDFQTEVIFDIKAETKLFSIFARQIYKKKYIYGTDVKLFRGKTISFQPARGMLLYLDGELLEQPNDVIEIEVSDKQLKVFC